MRYAIYHTPDQNHPLTRTAANWLGRDAFGGSVTAPEIPSVWTAGQHIELVRDARRYGFHATLKAPFELSDGCNEQDLVDAFHALKPAQKEIVIPSLVLRQIDGFFALVPDQKVAQLDAMVDLIVRELEPIRAALSPSDIARRNPESLSERQRTYLGRWGYPYVFEEFFFHMTLTGRVSGKDAEAVRKMLEHHFSAFIGKPYVVSHLAIFAEPARGEDFVVRAIRPVVSTNHNGKA